MSLPLVKVAYFVVERAAEPLSNRLEAAAANSPRFRSLCARLARAYNSLDANKEERRRERRERLWADDEAKAERRPVAAAPVLSEREAIESGCELLGQSFVLGVGRADTPGRSRLALARLG